MCVAYSFGIMEEATVVVISGCSSGIGLATAVLLAGAGNTEYKVFATMRNLGRKSELERAAGDNLNKSLFIRELDVSKEESVKTFAQDILKSEGKVDILINNAAWGLDITALEDVSLDKSRQLFETNFFGATHLTQQFIPSMKKRKSGHIIFMSSSSVLVGLPFGEMYTASKCALNGLAETLAPQLALFGVKVTTVRPGPVHTQFGNNLVPNGESEDDPETKTVSEKFLQTLQEYIQSGDAQTQEEIASVVKKVIEANKPDLHHYTSEHALELAMKKFTDPTGTSSLQAINDLYLKGIKPL